MSEVKLKLSYLIWVKLFAVLQVVKSMKKNFSTISMSNS
tara:strand:- start:225 stop:341 length:117 start_codon:yes stop_codon:yes gene_type:complete